MTQNPTTIVHMIGHLRLGAGRYIVDVAVRQASRSGRVTVLVSPDADCNWKTDPLLAAELRSAGIGVETVGDFFHRDLKELRATASRLRSLWGIDSVKILVHAHSAIGAAVARWAGAGTVVATCHGFDTGRQAAYDLQDALAFRLCDAVCTPSKYWADRLSSEMLVPDPAVIPVGLDMSRYSPPVREYGESRTPLRIVTVCELTERKGVDLLIAAMPLLWKRFTDLELHILGDGDAAPKLRDLGRALDPAGSRVVFHGFVADPYRQLHRFDLFALASRSDNLPVSVLEAMLAGLPVVATHVGGIPEMVLDGECGATVRPCSPEALADAVRAMILDGRCAMERMGRNGEAFARSRFDSERTVEELQTMYGRAIESRRRRTDLHRECEYA